MKRRLSKSDIPIINKRLLKGDELRQIGRDYGFYDGRALVRSLKALGAKKQPPQFFLM